MGSEQTDGAVLAAGAAEIVPDGGLDDKLAQGRPLRVKLGLDPTAGDVTLGWAVVLWKLRAFQDAGHTAVLILGDFTARIGDPSGQDSTRPMLSEEQVNAHIDGVLPQVNRILDPDRLEIRRNSEWLQALGSAGLLELASHQTVAQMLQRDDFAQRFAANAPITVREFLYPLLQGYDSVAVEADVELGGTDQHFNLLVGRQVQRVHGQEPQAILTMPLLEGTDGVKKMSQSLGNYIAITEAPDEMYGKAMRVPDASMPRYFELATRAPAAVVAEVLAQPPQDAKRELARAIVALYHGDAAASAAGERFDRIFVHHEIPGDVPEVAIPDEAVSGGEVDVARLVAAVGLAASLSQARRLLEQGGVRLDGEKLADPAVPRDRLPGRVLQAGKRRFVRLT